ncbi:MAG: hypothetical protein GWP47_13605 [Actinobacteria bacterium]|nr:hypothetical protein [Actinomycetota bacterium]
MSETKFNTVDGYAMTDIDGAPLLVGPARRAKKVLQRTTVDLVRHATYAAAFHGIPAAGAAVALNLDPAAEDQSPLTAFTEEANAWARSTNFTAIALMGLESYDTREFTHDSIAQSQELVAASASASAGDLRGKKVAISSEWGEEALTDQLNTASDVSMSSLGEALTSGADIVFVRGKIGMVNHEVVAETNVGKIVGLQPLTFTARGLAVASRAGAVIVPDFISAAGPVLAALANDADTSQRAHHVIQQVTNALAPHVDAGTALFVRAAESAEAFMHTWTNDLPFGRPLAP